VVTRIGTPSLASPRSDGADELGFHCEQVASVYETRRGAVQALRDVTFGARGHEFVGIVGPSGCGKTTLLRILAGLQQPTSGRVLFEDGGGSGRPRSALVFQEHGTFPWMTVLDNLAFGLEMRGVPLAERRARARDFADLLGLGSFTHHYPGDLSVGMRQRVDIGRAFVSDAPVLLMDEPFGALDAQTKWILQEELLRIWQTDRKLVVFITHDIDEAVRLSDRVLVMSGRPGTILEEIAVPLPRPRDLHRDLHAVREITWHIWQLLEHDIRTGLSIRS
jgi:NitT/TauT family transport system ATP-binding protein